MGFWPVPDVMAGSIYQLTPDIFTRRGVKLVLLDVDNTIAPYERDEASQSLVEWAQQMKDAGLELFILSNNRGQRPQIFSRALKIDFVGRAWKPFTGAARRVLAEKGRLPGETAIIGDQIYTDTACAKWLGAMAAVVQPICLHNPLLRLRYWLEAPFRGIYRLKNANRKKDKI